MNLEISCTVKLDRWAKVARIVQRLVSVGSVF